MWFGGITTQSSAVVAEPDALASESCGTCCGSFALSLLDAAARPPSLHVWNLLFSLHRCIVARVWTSFGGQPTIFHLVQVLGGDRQISTTPKLLVRVV